MTALKPLSDNNLPTSAMKVVSNRATCRLLVLLALFPLAGCNLLQTRPPAAATDEVAAPPPPPVPDPQLTDIQQQLQDMRQQLAGLSGQLADLKLPPPPPTSDAPPLRQTSPLPTPASAPANGARLADKAVVGKVEWLWLPSLDLNVAAETNTSAHLSSIFAVNQNIYEKDGQRWVRFELPTRAPKHGPQNGPASPVTLDLPVERLSRARQDGPDGPLRPVVRLPARLGSIHQVTEFWLADRPTGKLAVTLGRNFLSDMAIVDVSEQFLQPKYERPASGAEQAPATTTPDTP